MNIDNYIKKFILNKEIFELSNDELHFYHLKKYQFDININDINLIMLVNPLISKSFEFKSYIIFPYNNDICLINYLIYNHMIILFIFQKLYII